MPTGYNSGLTISTTLRQFAMRCARAMGPLFVLRDEPLDAPTDKAEVEDPYHAIELEKANAEESFLLALSPEEAEAEARKRYRAKMEEMVAKKVENDELRRAFERMNDLVRGWDPGDPDLVELRRFMLDQSSLSMSDVMSDEVIHRLYSPSASSGSEWRQMRLEEVRGRIKHHREGWEKEKKRAAYVRGWLAALRRSLPAE